MWLIYLLFFFDIIWLHIFSEFLSFVYMISKLSILPNHTKYLRGLATCYTLLLFTILKSPHPISQPTRLEKMTSVQERGYLKRKWVSKAPTYASSPKSDYEYTLGLIKLLLNFLKFHFPGFYWHCLIYQKESGINHSNGFLSSSTKR